ncbi:MAG: hypothetical protein LAO21_20420 [Acidobacteriia bacterium]|nr:hypothetical protein [Terriglobia bacterium]
MRKKIRKSNVETSEDKALSEAIRRVYQKYGTNLSAFVRDVHDELTMKRQDIPEQTEEIRAWRCRK